MTMARVATTLPWHTSRTRSFHQITGSRFAVDRQIEQHKFAGSVFDLQADSNRPDILQLQRRLLSDEFPFIPGYMRRRGVNVLVHDGNTHSVTDEPSLNRAANGRSPTLLRHWPRSKAVSGNG